MSSTPRTVTLRQSVALVWRTLRSMRTALVLLFMLALASVAGSLIPQEPNSPDKVAQYLRDHPLAGRFYEHAGLFDVFGSWWFVLITALLFTSLVMCLLPRTRATIRTVRGRPLHAREIDAFPQYVEKTVASPPEEAIERSQKVLRRRLFRVDRSGNGLAADKGMLREIGSLLFHWSLLLLLVGAIYGKGTGFTGRAAIIEGQTFTDAFANYDGNLRLGRFFDGDFSGAGIRLRDFQDAFGTTGTALDFVSGVDLLDPQGRLVRSTDIRVNHPASFDGLRIFQYGFGWAPDVELREGDRVLWSGPVLFTQDPPPPGVPQLALPWHGVVKLPSLEPQIGIQFVLWPSLPAFVLFQKTGQPVVAPTADHPIMTYTVWQGPLTDPSLRGLDTAGMHQVAQHLVGSGETVDLMTGQCIGSGSGCETDAGNALTVSFPDLKQYSVLQISRDRGVPFVLLAAILILVGLLPALYGSRRKVWVRAESNGGGTVLKVGGFALQRKTQFEEEFAKLVSELERASGEKVGSG